MSYGFVIEPDEGEVIEGSGLLPAYAGEATNNIAEYLALIEGLKAALEIAGDGEPIAVWGDSRVVLNGMTGYKSHTTAPLRLLRQESLRLSGKHKVSFNWVSRRENTYADFLARQALKTQSDF